MAHTAMPTAEREKETARHTRDQLIDILNTRCSAIPTRRRRHLAYTEEINSPIRKSFKIQHSRSLAFLAPP